MNVDPENALVKKLQNEVSGLLELTEEENTPLKIGKSDPKVADAIASLQSIKRTVDMFFNAQSSMPHIAIFGQFSAGKSSLINALAREALRTTDPDVVDQHVTIVSHEQNVTEAGSNPRFRMNYAVQSQTTDNPFFLKRHLVDMPGSGDRDDLERLVEEFLPICDWIIWATSSLAAFRSDEAQLLNLVATKFKEIPISIVFTYGDYFLRDTDDGRELDQSRFQKFLDGLEERIARKLEDELKYAELIPVENHSDKDGPVDFASIPDGFGIAKLRDHIAGLSLDPVKNHSAKITLFSRWVDEQAIQLHEFLKSLDEALSKLIQKVQETRDDFDSGYDVSFRTFGEFWERSEKSIAEIISRIEEKFLDLSELQNAPDKPELKELIFEQMDGLLVEIRSRVDAEIATFIRSKITELIAEPNGLPTGRNPVDIEDSANLRANLQDVLPSMVENELSGIIEASAVALAESEARTLRLRALDLRSWSDAALKGETFLYPITRDEDLRQQFKRKLEGELPHFSKALRAYQTTVLAADTLDLIAKTGFTTDLDNLGANAIPEITEMTEEILYEVFGDDETGQRKLAREEYRAQTRSFSQVIENAQARATKFITHNDRFQDELIGEVEAVESNLDDAERANLIELILTPSQAKARRSLSALKDEAQRLLSDAENSVAEFKRGRASRRKRQLLLSVIVAAFIGIVLLTASLLNKIPSPYGWITDIGFGAIGSIISGGIMHFGQAVLNSDTKQVEREARRSYSDANSDYIEFLKTYEPEGNAEIDGAFTAVREKLYSQVFAAMKPAQASISALTERQSDSLEQMVSDISDSRERLLAATNTFSADMRKWYSVDGQSDAAFETVSKRYKSITIDKALALFEVRRSIIQNTITRISQLARIAS